MARRYRPRKEFKFWLYHDLDEDKRLMEFIRFCKSTQQFACMVRNGLRLMWSLGEGNTAVLYELFPWLQTQAALLAPAPNTENLERQITDLKQIILEQRNISAPSDHYPSLKPGLGGLKKLALPIIDNDDDTIVLNKNTNTTPIDNFFASFAKLGS